MLICHEKWFFSMLISYEKSNILISAQDKKNTSLGKWMTLNKVWCYEKRIIKNFCIMFTNNGLMDVILKYFLVRFIYIFFITWIITLSDAPLSASDAFKVWGGFSLTFYWIEFRSEKNIRKLKNIWRLGKEEGSVYEKCLVLNSMETKSRTMEWKVKNFIWDFLIRIHFSKELLKFVNIFSTIWIP